MVVLGIMAAFGLHELSKQTAEEFPGLTFGEIFAPTRKRISSAVSDANLGERASKIKLPEVRRPGGMSLPDVRRPGGQRGDRIAAETPTGSPWPSPECPTPSRRRR